MKTEAGRGEKIAAFVEMLKRGETIYPRRSLDEPGRLRRRIVSQYWPKTAG